jgi:hypothetical protein
VKRQIREGVVMNAKEPANLVSMIRRMTRGLVLVAAGAVVVHVAPTYAQQVQVRGNCAPTTPATVTVPVDFVLQDTSVAGVQNDVVFDAAKFQYQQGPTGTGTCNGNPDTPCVSDDNCNGQGPCNRNQGPLCVVGQSTSAAGKGAYFSDISDARIRGIAVGIDPPNSDAFTRDPRLYECQLNILAGTANGSYQLVSPPESAIASDPSGTKLPAKTPQEGYIVVGTPACIGDLNGSGAVQAFEYTRGLLDFAEQENYRNPASDFNCNGIVSSSEYTKTLNSFANQECVQG